MRRPGARSAKTSVSDIQELVALADRALLVGRREAAIELINQAYALADTVQLLNQACALAEAARLRARRPRKSTKPGKPVGLVAMAAA